MRAGHPVSPTAQRSLRLWAAAFSAALAVVVRGWEESHLSKRYGNEYVEYPRNVPAWIADCRPETRLDSGQGVASQLGMWVRWVTRGAQVRPSRDHALGQSATIRAIDEFGHGCGFVGRFVSASAPRRRQRSCAPLGILTSNTC
jgi:hypothetical protein